MSYTEEDRAKVIDTLFRPGVSLHIREIASSASVTEDVCRDILYDLQADGLVARVRTQCRTFASKKRRRS